MTVSGWWDRFQAGGFDALAAQRRGRREGAEIHWGDETCLSTSDPRGRGFARRGQTPVLEVVSRRKSVRVLSTVTNQGLVRFMVLEGPLTAPMLIRFLGRLIRSTNHTVFLILDNLNVHKAATVRAHRRTTGASSCRGAHAPPAVIRTVAASPPR